MPPVLPDRQPSAYSLPERSESAIVQHAAAVDRNNGRDFEAADDEDGDDDGRSSTSSRSDRSEEAAGLVSRLSDDEDRANRRSRYEGGARLGAATTTGSAKGSYRESEDSERGTVVSHSVLSVGKDGAGVRHSASSSNASLSLPEREHSIAPSDVRDGVFRDRGGDVHRPRRPKVRRAAFARVWEIAREALPTLLLSLVSLMLSGELLIHLSKWPVFSKVDKLFILIPILLNLKGNLEGNLSLRMSTSANIGELDVRRTRETLIFGNLALLQVQALIVSLFAGILSFLLGLGTGTEPAKGNQPSAAVSTRRLAPRRVIHHHPTTDPSLKMRNGYFEFVLVIATAMLSASVSSAVLGTFMCALVVITRRRGGNPDNIASPLAGSLGDLLTLTLLGLLSSFMVRFEGTILATMILLGLAFVCLTFFVLAYRNAYVRELLSSGWIPLVVAMFISSGAGVVLDTFVQRFEGFALLVPVITGLPGACAAIFVSRTSTALHGGHSINKPMSGGFFRRQSSNRSSHPFVRILSKITPRWLTGVGGPTEGWTVPMTIFGLGLLVVMSFITLVRLSGQMSFGLPFFFMFVIAATVQLACSLLIAHVLTLLLWRYDYDPDIYCLPYVSSVVDVIGQVILVTAYFIAISLGDTITASVNEGHR